MTTFQERSAQSLARAMNAFGVRAEITASEDGVVIRSSTAQRLRSAIGHVEGGSRVPFIRTLLHSVDRTDITLRGDEARHLARALDDVHRQQQRNDQIDRGQIPGALSGSEVARLIRRNPHLFTGAGKRTR